MGLKVVGIEISQRSLDYAKKQAETGDLDIDYSCQDFFEIEFKEEFDHIIQVNGELNTFSDVQRDKLLSKLWQALKPEGLLVFDVTTRALRQKYKLGNSWYAGSESFWRDRPHLVLEHGFDYPEDDVFLNRYIVFDQEGVTDYRLLFHDYSLETLQPVLEKSGFKIIHVWNDLAGTVYQKGGDWFAVVSKKCLHKTAD